MFTYADGILTITMFIHYQSKDT